MAKTTPAPNTAPVPTSAYDRMMHARKLKEDWAKVEATAREEIEAAMGDNELGTIRGRTVVTWKHTKSARFDQAAFSKDHPDLKALYTTTTEGRRFVPVDQA